MQHPNALETLLESSRRMSLDWNANTTLCQDDEGNSLEARCGKRTGGFHPLQDCEDGKIVSEEEQRSITVTASKLPAQSRNGSRLSREDVKRHVLATYTANVPIASFVSLDEDKLSDQDRARMRADRLGTESTQHSAQANQTNLIRLIEGLDADLKDFWSEGEKVKALRVAIQATKLLSINKVPHCYPSIFVLVATVLDTFGNFVSERLQATAAGKSFVVAALIKRGQDAAIDLIPPEAVEMCYNWFLKISSIRELLPRICVELSLLKCNKFVAKKARVQSAEVVCRLAKQIRGVADPLVACHLRWYLFMRAAEVLKSDEWASILESTCLDSFLTMEQLKSHYFERLWAEKDITREHYLSLFIPALQWQLDSIAKFGARANRELFIRSVFDQSMKFFYSSALLLPLIRAFRPEDWMRFGWDALLVHIDEVQCSRYVSKLRLMEAFALLVAEHEPPLPLSRAKKTALLNEMWGRVETCREVSSCDGDSSNVLEFLDACSALIQFCAVHLAAKQVNVLLAVVRKTMETQKGNTSVHHSIFRLLSSLVVRSPDISPLLASDHFLTLLRHVAPENRHQLSKTMLCLLPRDEKFVDVTLELAKTLHETYDLLALSSEEQQQCTSIIVAALRAVASPDAERQIELMCEARHALPNLDAVKVALVNHALSLVHHFGKASKKRNAAKAFLAFCHVTIPAATNVFSRLQMSVEAAGTAFLHGFVAQGEAILKLAMDFMKELVPRSTLGDGTVVGHCDDVLRSVLQLVGIGAITPSHAKYGHNYVLGAVSQWNDAFLWDASSTGRAEVNCAIVRCLSKGIAGGSLAYAFHKCGTSNYNKDPDYIKSSVELCTAAATSTLLALRAAGDNPPSVTAMGRSAMILFETCVAFGDVLGEGAVGVREICSEAWAIANKCHTGTDVGYTRQFAALSRFAMGRLGSEEFSRATNVAAARAARKLLEKQLASEES